MPEKLEIHKVFLRFSGFVSRKICSPIRTLRFNQRFLRKPYNDRTLTDIELCKYISRIYREGKHLQNYDSLEEFGFHELGIDKSSIFMYKNVGEKLLDSNGDLLIMRGSEWGLGSLNELYTLDIETINTLIEQGIIYPSMKQKELRERIKKIKEFLMKM